jgi:predicted dehydrogenase
VQVIAAGCTHVYLEKPGAPTVGELEEMKAFAASKGVPVYMGYNKNVRAAGAAPADACRARARVRACTRCDACA